MFEDKEFLEFSGIKYLKSNNNKISDAPRFRFVEKVSSKLKLKTHKKVTHKSKKEETVPEQ